MDISPAFKDLLRAFNAERVRYLLVGGYAYAYHVEPRYTKDLEIWVDASPSKAERVWRALGASVRRHAVFPPADGD